MTLLPLTSLLLKVYNNVKFYIQGHTTIFELALLIDVFLYFMWLGFRFQSFINFDYFYPRAQASRVM